MTPAEFHVLAERLRKHTEYLYLHLMGEPLLHPQLEELLGIAAELGFRVIITTNGTLLPERGALLLKSEAVHKVNISLQSFEGNGGDEPEDCLRGFRGGGRGEREALRPAAVEFRRLRDAESPHTRGACAALPTAVGGVPAQPAPCAEGISGVGGYVRLGRRAWRELLLLRAARPGRRPLRRNCRALLPRP